MVYGAAGGVGTALIDVARHAGATVIGTAGSDEKCDFVRERGAAHAINYNTQNVVERVNALTAATAPTSCSTTSPARRSPTG